MQTPAIGERHNRKALPYQTDLTDAEWAVMAPHLPPPLAAGRPLQRPELAQGVHGK